MTTTAEDVERTVAQARADLVVARADEATAAAEVQACKDHTALARSVRRSLVPVQITIALILITTHAVWPSTHWAAGIAWTVFPFVLSLVFIQFMTHAQQQFDNLISEQLIEHDNKRRVVTGCEDQLIAALETKRAYLDAEENRLDLENWARELVVMLAIRLNFAEIVRLNEEARIDDLGHILYRLFGDDGVLLYIGITDDTERRFREHAESKTWWRDVVEVRLEYLTSRAELEAMERLSIIREHPRHNVTHKQVMKP